MNGSVPASRSAQKRAGHDHYFSRAIPVNESTESTELLIKEAREASRRRRLKVVALSLAFAVIVVLAIAVGSGRTNPKKATRVTSLTPPSRHRRPA